MPSDARPYLVPSEETLRHQPWRYLLEEEWVSLPQELLGWDGFSDIAVRAAVSIDMAQLYGQTLIPAGTPIMVSVSWRSSTSGMVDSAAAQVVPETGHIQLEATLVGGRIGGSLSIRTSVTLGAAHTVTHPWVAHRPGSVLLESTQIVALDPPSSMFPVHDLDFAAVPGLDDQASWHLEMPGDLEAPFLGTCRLLLNTRDAELLGAVKRQRKDPRQEALVDELTHGVAVVLLEMAVHHRSSLLGRGTWPDGTVGEVLTAYLMSSDSHLPISAPRDPDDIPGFRSRVSGGARALGHGRSLG